MLLPFSTGAELLSENYVGICRLLGFMADIMITMERHHYLQVYRSMGAVGEIGDKSLTFLKQHAVLIGYTTLGRTKEELIDLCHTTFSISIDDRLGKTNTLCSVMRKLNTVTSFIMSKCYDEENHIARTKAMIHEFLVAMEAFSPGDIIAKYNFLSFLNVPRIMEELGPISNIWEGGTIGEKILTIVKPNINKNAYEWEKATLKNVAVDLIVSISTRSYFEDITRSSIYKDTIGHIWYKRSCEKKQYYAYKNYEHVESILKQHGSISCFIFQKRLYVYTKPSHFFYEIDVTGESFFLKLTLKNEAVTKSTIDNSCKYILMLPFVNTDDDRCYIGISSEWKYAYYCTGSNHINLMYRT